MSHQISIIEKLEQKITNLTQNAINESENKQNKLEKITSKFNKKLEEVYQHKELYKEKNNKLKNQISTM